MNEPPARKRHREYLEDCDFPPEAIDYFEAHLAKDPLTTKMLARLTMVADELTKAGLASALGAAMFLRALDLGEAGCSAELPFALDETTAQAIDGAQSKPAMQRHCTRPETRQLAAVLNTARQIGRQKTSYAWADELLREGPLKTHAQICLGVVDDALARVALELNDDLRFLPRLDTREDPDTGETQQIVMATSLVLYWVDDGQVHCGMSERYGAGWERVVRHARRRGYQVHDGFQGPALDDQRIEELVEAGPL